MKKSQNALGLNVCMCVYVSVFRFYIFCTSGTHVEIFFHFFISCVYICYVLFLGKLQNVENAVREENKLSQEEENIEVRDIVYSYKSATCVLGEICCIFIFFK